MNECPKCHNEYPDGVKFCPQDGSRLDVAETDGDPLVGTIFSKRYEVLERVASGGFGTIYKVRNLQLDTIEALKLLHHNVARDKEQIERFRREAQLLRRISSATEFVPRLHDFDRDDDRRQWYFTLEFLDGASLHEAIAEAKSLDPARAIMLMRQICAALQVAHELQDPEIGAVTHRDLKPHNIMLVQREGVETVKILDFGIAKAAHQTGLTAVGVGIGTPGYMSPEQIEGRVDSRTDLFAAGVCYYNMITGQDPWLGRDFGTPSGESEYEVIRLTKEKEPILPREVNPDISPAVEGVVLKLLEKEPENRFQTAMELDAELEKIQLNIGVPDGGRLRVKSVPSGASVVLKRGAATVGTGITPWEVGPLPPGTYEVHLRAKHCEPARGRVKLERNETDTVEFPLTRLPSSQERLAAAVSSVASRFRSALATGAHEAAGGAGSLGSRIPWRKVGIGGSVVAAVALLVFVALGPLSRPIHTLIYGPPSITSADLLREMNSGRLASITISEDGGIEAVIDSAGGGAYSGGYEVDRGSFGLQALLRSVRGADVPIESADAEAHLRIVRETPGSGDVTSADVAVRSTLAADLGCSPCETEENLSPEWYRVVSGEGWRVESMRIEAGPNRGAAESLDPSEAVYLAGGLTTVLTLQLSDLTRPVIDSLATAARQAIATRDWEEAIVHIRTLEGMASGAALSRTLREEIAVWHADQADNALASGRYADARQYALECLGVISDYSACVTARDSAENARRNRPGPGRPPPPSNEADQLAGLAEREIGTRSWTSAVQRVRDLENAAPNDSRAAGFRRRIASGLLEEARTAIAVQDYQTAQGLAEQCLAAWSGTSACATARDSAVKMMEPQLARVSGTWDFSETLSDADGNDCATGPHDLSLTQTDGSVSGSTQLTQSCGAGRPRVQISWEIVSGNVTTGQIELVARRGTDTCTYTASISSTSPREITGGFTCQTSGASGTWWLDR